MTIEELAEYDFRKLYLLTEEQRNKWKDLNSNKFYRMLWFHTLTRGPDVERHPMAVELYKKLYEMYGTVEWIACQGKGRRGSKLYKKGYGSLTADVMNGWWGPVKLFLNLSGERDAIIKNLIEKSQIKDPGGVMDWLISQSGETDKTCNAMLEFLDVIYTIGNFTPVPEGENKKADQLDCWAYKLYRIYIYHVEGSIGWQQLIDTHWCGEDMIKQREKQWNTFVAKNKYQYYLSPDKKPIAYWKIGDNPNSNDFTPPKKDIKEKSCDEGEWHKYFTETKERIVRRSKALVDGHEDAARGISLNQFLL